MTMGMEASEPLVGSRIVALGCGTEATIAPDDKSVVPHTSQKIRRQFFNATLFGLIYLELPQLGALDAHQ
jgi:hypothetical protein